MTEEFKRLVVGTAGHIDHGKTTLVHCLTGTDTDRLPEEQSRGMSIELGFARLELEDHLEVDFIDVPGHERFIGTMTSGASGIEAALLVIAVDDGVMPQTREHLRILTLLNIRDIIVLISKCDLADDEYVEWQREAISEFLDEQKCSPAAILPISAKTGEGLEKLRNLLKDLATKHTKNSSQELGILAVDRAFSLPGQGRVVTGTLRQGTFALEMPLYLHSNKAKEILETKCRGLHRHGVAESLVDGPSRVALSVKSKKKVGLEKGDWVSTTPMVLTDCLLVYITDLDEELAIHEEIEFHCGTSMRIARPKGTGLTREQFAFLELNEPCWLIGGLRFILRQSASHGKVTVGGGEIADARQPKFKGVYQDLKRLNAHPSESELITYIGRGSRVLELNLNDIGTRFNGQLQAAVERAVKGKQYRQLISRDGSLASTSHLHEAQLAVVATIKSELADRPEASGLPENVIYSKLPRWSKAELQHAVKQGLENDTIARRQGLLRAQAASETLDPRKTPILERVKALLMEADAMPPSIPELAKALRASPRDVRDVVQKLHHHREVIKLAPDLYSISTTAERIIPKVIAALQSEDLMTAAALKPLIAEGISRKWAIPWLEYLDRAKVTVRRGNERSLHPSRRVNS